MHLFVFRGLKPEAVTRSVDIGGSVCQHWLNFLFYIGTCTKYDHVNSVNGILITHTITEMKHNIKKDSTIVELVNDRC